MAVFPFHLVLIHTPRHGCPSLAVGNHGLASLSHCHAGGKGGTTAAGDITEACAFRIAYLCADIIVIHAQGFRRHQAHGCSGTTNVWAALDNHHRAVFVDVHFSTGLHAHIEPKTHGHASAGAFWHRLGVVGVILSS